MEQSVALRQWKLELKTVNGRLRNWWNVVANKEYIARLQKAIKHLHGAESKHVESVAVQEVFRRKTLWKGVVEVFTLIGHPKAQRAYAWSYMEGQNNETEQFVAVLELPPVDSPQAAVKVAVGEAVNKVRSSMN
jgi:hypothetical protein